MLSPSSPHDAVEEGHRGRKLDRAPLCSERAVENDGVEAGHRGRLPGRASPRAEHAADDDAVEAGHRGRKPDRAPLCAERAVHDYAAEGLKVYLKDIRLDPKGNPVILVITSEGYESGPENGPRTWTLLHWSGSEWKVRPVTTSDSNYDMGSLYL